MASKILYVCQEITPYLPETEGSRLCRALTQAMQERGNEIRTFMPRYGCINARRTKFIWIPPRCVLSSRGRFRSVKVVKIFQRISIASPYVPKRYPSSLAIL